MNKQFFYTRKVESQLKIEGQEPKFDEFLDSFNLDYVIKTLELEGGKRLVLLDDFHQEMRDVPNINPKNGKFNGYKKERNTYCSEIVLEKEDAEKYVKLYV